MHLESSDIAFSFRQGQDAMWTRAVPRGERAVLIAIMRWRKSEPPNERAEAPERVRFHAVADARPVDVPADEASVLQDLEVLGNGGLCERKLLHDIATNAALLTEQQAKYLYASWMSDGFG
jgi:hypothetical protein